MARDSMIQVAIVLSSGLPLCELELSSLSSIRDLRLQLSAVLTDHMRAYKAMSIAHAVPLRLPITQEVYFMLKAICSQDIRLFAFQGGELEEYQKVNEVKQPIAVVRPTSDRVVSTYNSQGKRGRAVLLSLSEDLVWEDGSQANTSEIDLLICSIQQVLLLCSVSPFETVQMLTTRLEAITGIPLSDIRLWYKGGILLPTHTVQFYSLSNRSRIALQPPGTALAFITATSGRYGVIPIKNTEGFEVVETAAHVLEKQWCWCKCCFEYNCICPISPLFSHFFLVCMPSDRCLILNLKDGRSETVLIPAICTVKEAKKCIEDQHGLPAALIFLTVLEELPVHLPFSAFGVNDNDQLLLIAKKPTSKVIPITVTCGTGSQLYTCKATDSIGLLKQDIRQTISALTTDDILLIRDTEILQDSASFASYGIYDRVVLECGERWNIQNKLQKIKRSRFLCTKEREEKEENEVNLFETGQKVNWKTGIERKERYEAELLQSREVKVITSAQVFSLIINDKTPVRALKERIAPQITVQSYKIAYKGRELDDNQTLVQQNVETGSHLLLISPSDLVSTVVTPSGQHYPVVLPSQGKLPALNSVLEQLFGLQAGGQGVILMKQLNCDSQQFPTGIERVTMSLKLGSGGLFTLTTPAGFTVGVEGNAGVSVEEMQEAWGKSGGRGTVSRGLD